MTTEVVSEPNTFGNFRAPRSYGYGNLPLFTTVAGFIGMLVFLVLTFFTNILVGGIFVVLLAGALALVTFKDKHQQSKLDKITIRLAYRKARRAGHVDYLSGPITQHGSFKLPGLLATSELTEHQTTMGQPFAMLYLPKQRHYVIALACEPDGASLLDTKDAEMQVARWALFFERMGDEMDLRQIQVTVETVPDSGSNLRNAVSRRLDPNAPELAREVMEKIMQTYPATSARENTWVVLTYRANGRSRQEMADYLATEIPQTMHTLIGTGAGQPTPVDALTYSQTVMVAYDPELAETFDKYEVETMVRWNDVGPTAAHAAWDHYRHDSGISVTYGMSVGPKSNIRTHTLNALLEPHTDIPRKRVSLIFQVFDAAASADLAEADAKTTRARMNTTRNPSERAIRDRESAVATSKEEAAGAVVVDFTVMATITVTDAAKLAKAKATLLRTSPTSRIRLRPFNGSQDSAFSLNLPTGIVHKDVVTIPSGIREGF